MVSPWGVRRGCRAWVLIFPAMAIPIQEKLSFECPEEHVKALKASISKCGRILVIGWRGPEQPFLELQEPHLVAGVPGKLGAHGWVDKQLLLLNGGVEGNPDSSLGHADGSE